MDELNKLKNECLECHKCSLGDTRNNVVFGVGNPKAILMFIGEGPGEQEDLSGIPFVGKAGQLFDKMIKAIELTRDDVYIANIVKCRPPRNRNPQNDEAMACIPYLYKQIELINPDIIVCLGKVAATYLIHSDYKITKERGRWKVIDKRRYIMAIYHPSFLLRDPSRKAEAWIDLKEIKKAYKYFDEKKK